MVQKKLPTINSSHGSETRNIINELIKLFNGMGYTYDQALQKAHDVLSEAQKTNNMNQDVQKQINNLILSDGESDAEVIQARGDHEILKSRFENIESKYFDANDYGADVSANWQTNRDAFQAANDAAYANGGGVVVASPGVYEVKGIIQDSHVTFDLPGTTLKSPDGLTHNIIEGRVHETTGSINKDSKALTVSDTYGIEVGSIISIGKSDGYVDTQFTKLINSITSSQTSGITVENGSRFPANGVMRIGEELISYTNISNGVLTNVSRGVYGTTPSSHSADSFIGLAKNLVTEVLAIDGNTLSLKDSPNISVSSTDVLTGVMNPGVNITKIDGNRVTGGSPSSLYGLQYALARHGKINDFTLVNGDMGAIILTRGTADFNIGNVTIIDTGVFDGGSSSRGSGLWMFNGAKRNVVKNIRVYGMSWSAFYIDDRTATGSGWDSPCEENIIMNIHADIIYPDAGFQTAGLIVGSNNNKVLGGFIRGSRVSNTTAGGSGGGIEVSGGGQYVMGDGGQPEAYGNEIGHIQFDVGTPWRLHSPGNTLHDCTYSENATAVPPVAEGNFVYASSTSPGGMPVINNEFQRGRQNNPSITFKEDNDTGFYRHLEDTVGLSLGGTNKVTWYPTEMRLSDGLKLTTGTNIGTTFGLTPSQKLGFFGTTPKVQQSAIERRTGDDLASLESRLNRVLDTLRELGFIAPS